MLVREADWPQYAFLSSRDLWSQKEKNGGHSIKVKMEKDENIRGFYQNIVNFTEIKATIKWYKVGCPLLWIWTLPIWQNINIYPWKIMKNEKKEDFNL